MHVFRVSDGRLRLDLLRPTGSNGAVALDALGRAEVFGDAGRHLQCKIGARVVLAEICDNLQVAGLAKSTMAEP